MASKAWMASARHKLHLHVTMLCEVLHAYGICLWLVKCNLTGMQEYCHKLQPCACTCLTPLCCVCGGVRMRARTCTCVHPTLPYSLVNYRKHAEIQKHINTET